MASERNSVAVLLGAGASADAGIPMTVQMTDEIIDRMQDPRHRRILEFLRHTIAADLARERPKLRPLNEPVEIDTVVDVERLFASVDLLVGRNEQPWSPFVATWHPSLESFSPPRRPREFDLSSELRRFEEAINAASASTTRYFPRRSGQVRDALWKVIDKAIGRSTPGDVSELLARVRDEMLRSLFDLVNISDPSVTAYLVPLTELAKQQGSLTIATLNYDRSIENAAELVGEACDTGIETWLERGALTWPDVGLRLLKLHGSIDWVVERGGGGNLLPMLRIRKVADPAEKAHAERPAVVFGEAGKLRSEGPYLELLLAWSTQIQRADTLLVVGYSFRDDHVNELIARWFNADPKRRIVVVDPTDPAQTRYGSFAWELANVDNDFPGDRPPQNLRVQYVIGRTAEALPDGIRTATEGASGTA